jgi:hypothetical protein
VRGSGIRSERDFTTEGAEYTKEENTEEENTEEDNAETLRTRRFAEIFGGNG